MKRKRRAATTRRRAWQKPQAARVPVLVYVTRELFNVLYGAAQQEHTSVSRIIADLLHAGLDVPIVAVKVARGHGRTDRYEAKRAYRGKS